MYFSINVIVQNQLILGISATYLLQLFAVVTIIPLIPRFIIRVREIFDRDARGRFRVDTGFGTLGPSVDDESTFVSTILFVDGNSGQGESRVLEEDMGDSEGIRLEVMGEGARRV